MELCIHSSLPTHKHRTCGGRWDKRPTQGPMENKGWRTRTKSQDWIPRPGPWQLCCSCRRSLSSLHSKGLGLGRREMAERKGKPWWLLCSRKLPEREPKCPLIHANGLHRKFLLKKWRSYSTALGNSSSPRDLCSFPNCGLSFCLCLTAWKTGTFSALNLTIQVYYLSFCSLKLDSIKKNFLSFRWTRPE